MCKFVDICGFIEGGVYFILVLKNGLVCIRVREKECFKFGSGMNIFREIDGYVLFCRE